LVALEAAILRQDTSLVAVAEPATASELCPYKGLAYYDVDDSALFFGRQAEVTACLERMRSTSLLVVAGPSGCGKSSLVRAGLVPLLRGRGQDVVVVVPGGDPVATMIDAVVSVGKSDVLVIDQFEEVFTLGSPPAVVQEFCQRVGEHARDRAAVVIVVRSDHLGGLAVDPCLSRLAEQGLHLVNPLVGDALREAIEQPAAHAGLRLEPGLVDVLVRDCEGEPGALPLMSHALVETWRRRDGTVLSLEGYRASGGIRAAVARSADRLYDSLTPDQRLTLRSVLLRLVTPSLDGDPVRCRVPSRNLLGDPVRERVVALLVRSRLVTCEADAFELAHEALARAWPRLQSWLEEDAEGQRVLRHLTTAADGWESLGRPAGELYRAARLEAALEWRDATKPDLTAVERAFLEMSETHATAEAGAMADRAARDARQNRRLRTLLVASAILLTASLAAGALALLGRRDARQQRDAAHIAQERAEREGRVAVGRELTAAATANLPIDPERSVLLALEAVEQTRSADGTVLPEAEEALHRALTADRIVLRVRGVGGALDWSPDGRWFVTEGRPGDGIVDIRDTRTGQSARTFPGHDDITDVAFNHDGTQIVTTGADGAARVWDPATGEMLQAIEWPGGGGARGPAFSDHGAYLAVAWPEADRGTVRVLDVATAKVVREITSVSGPISTSFEPGGQRLVIASSQEPMAAVVDIGSGETSFTLEGHFAALNDATWSPDGALIATASNDGSVRLFDASNGRQRFALRGHSSIVNALDWSPDSTRLLTGSADGTAKLWSLIEGDGRELATLSAYDTRLGVVGAVFSPDGTQVMTGDQGVTSAIIWDIGATAGAEVANLPGVAFHFGAVDFSADGQRLYATAGGGSIGVWDQRTWTSVRTFGGRTAPTPSAIPGVPVGTADDVERLAADPTGRLVAALRADDAGRIEVWDAETGKEVFTIVTDSGFPWFTWSPDGQVLAVTDGTHGRVIIVDRSGREVNRMDVRDVWAGHIAFSPDGDRLVMTLEPLGPYDPTVGRVVLWNWRTGETERRIDTEAQIAISSPTGDLIAVAPHWQSDAQAVDVWAATTGELITSLAGQTGSVTDIAFSPDGSRLATSSADGTIRLWDPRTGDQQLALHGHSASVSAISFNPDGSQLASVGAEGIVRIWAIDLDDLMEIARSSVTRALTDDECTQYLHTQDCPDPIVVTEPAS
jgi:WD40 repeat protein